MNCRVCGTEHSGRAKRNAPSPYCSDACRSLAWKFRVRTLRTCVGCGQVFRPRRSNGKGYCSRECANKHWTDWHAVRPKLYKKDKGRHAHRAKRIGVEHELVHRQKVFARDGWKCGICGEPINKALLYPHIMSVSLDHIVPMSRGGGHTYANTQAAHWICNVIKSNGLPGQSLARVG